MDSHMADNQVVPMKYLEVSVHIFEPSLERVVSNSRDSEYGNVNVMGSTVVIQESFRHVDLSCYERDRQDRRNFVWTIDPTSISAQIGDALTCRDLNATGNDYEELENDGTGDE
ncbi:hypothetical protein Taro_032410 [Colocasia esculenta]|uniref:Uncharacterized protein n=1 Tax=Colocasia esculenta TaxID=4460 RepID=A0A843W3U5_COLES|nr:hypothetical protein [Colocasia esculenta]